MICYLFPSVTFAMHRLPAVIESKSAEGLLRVLAFTLQLQKPQKLSEHFEEDHRHIILTFKY